jgi:hypothetical protein
MMRLIDADAMKEEWKMGDVCEECKQDVRQCGNDYCFTRMDVCGMLDDTQTIGGWISVKDKLPENNTVCLTYSPKGKMRVAEAFLPSSLPNSKYDPMECWWSTHGAGGTRFVAVTHWMPLPEPPKEVK